MYAQKNYLATQGVNGKYRISQVGSLLVAMCNLLEASGKSVDPLTLNKFFADNKVYHAGSDGVVDDLSPEDVLRYAGDTLKSATEQDGLPDTNNAIIMMRWLGQDGNSITHYSVVDDWEKGTIVDSWDGQVKNWHNYGGVEMWWSFDGL